MTETTHLIDEREKTHGKYAEVAECLHRLNQVCAAHAVRSGKTVFPTSSKTVFPIPLAVALGMINVKIARIVCGDQNHLDHWRDIAGYAELALREIERNADNDQE